MKNFKKLTITLILILSILIPTGYFLISPQITEIKIKLSQLDPYKISKEKAFSLLTTISPYKVPSEQSNVLGATTIEEALSNQEINLDRKILEELNMSLSIKSINVDGAIYQGTDSLTMEKGFWHYPISNYPGEKGNVVIIGHRFQKIPPETDTFYNLDKVNVGDEIVINHTEGEYKYIVVNSHIIDPTDISILEESNDYRLTLVTCTPLWTSEKRLVITAKLDKLYKKV